ncbi:MAG: methyl-accepting chemotaxis protein [Spirochaetota bacterium]
MKWFKNLNIPAKLLVGFMMVAVITGVVGLVGINNMSRINSMANIMYDQELQGIRYLKDANIQLINSGRAEKNAILATTSADRKDFLDSTRTYDKKAREYFNKARPLITSGKGKELVAEFQEQWDDYSAVADRVIDTIRSEGLSENRKSIELSMGTAREKMDNLDIILDKINRIKEKNAEDYKQATTELYESSSMFMIILVIGGVLAGILIGFFISGLIKRPLYKVVNMSKKLADGDFTDRIEIEQDDELGELARSFNKTTEELEKLVSEIVVASQNLGQAVQEIASGNENLSQRTSEQASSLEEIAATIEESNATTKQNADNALEANKLAENSSNLAENGGLVVLQAIESINEINQSSSRIAEITTMINDIAFQTNLLALNAAVEAARAGDQGRGFAVVAGEVRNLAQRSGNAAREINELIGTSVERIEKGTDQVNQSGQSLKDIIDAVKQVDRIVSEISAASEEQRRGIDQINVAVTDMDTMTQQNAAMVEQTASAGEEMANQAQELLAMMEKFNVRDEVKEETYSGKHKEIHLRTAREVKNKAEKTSRDNGDGKDSNGQPWKNQQHHVPGRKQGQSLNVNEGALQDFEEF